MIDPAVTVGTGEEQAAGQPDYEPEAATGEQAESEPGIPRQADRPMFGSLRQEASGPDGFRISGTDMETILKGLALVEQTQRESSSRSADVITRIERLERWVATNRS
jgi:hypothetical protein